MASKAKVAVLRDLQRQSGKIVQAFYQKGGFRIELDKQLQATTGKRSQEKARAHVKDAVKAIKDQLDSGIGGARTSSSRRDIKKGARYSPVSGNIYVTGASFGGINYKFFWEQLSPSTIVKKRGSAGAGTFWKFKGSGFSNSLSAFAKGTRVPRINSKVKVVDISKRRASRLDATRIDFTVTTTFGKMNFPFDELVRRPLITGEYSDTPLGSSGNGPSSIFSYLEHGVPGEGGWRIPPRPWIGAVSAEIGKVMFKNLSKSN